MSTRRLEMMLEHLLKHLAENPDLRSELGEEGVPHLDLLDEMRVINFTDGGYITFDHGLVVQRPGGFEAQIQLKLVRRGELPTCQEHGEPLEEDDWGNLICPACITATQEVEADFEDGSLLLEGSDRDARDR